MHPLNIYIKPALQTDAEHCLVIGRAIVEAMQDKSLNVVPTTLESVRTELLSKKAWMIHADGVIIGYIVCENHSERCVYIAEVQIHPGYQGKGVGPEAMRFMMDTFPEASCFELVTHPKNARAIRAYEKLGFTKEEHMNNWRETGQPRLKMVRWVK